MKKEIWALVLLGVGTMSGATAQDRLWVLNEGRYDWVNGSIEVPPSLGYVDTDTWSYQEVAVFADARFATDMEVTDEHAFVALEGRVVKLNLESGFVVAQADVLGVQELALTPEGDLFLTRGGIDASTYEPLALSSFFAWLDAEDLSWEGELTPEQGPAYPSQEIAWAEGQVFVGVNNGWAWQAEVGKVGIFTPSEGTYVEHDLGEGAPNPVAIHFHNGTLLTVNNGDWSSTSVSRLELGEVPSVVTTELAGVSAGCNASALVGDRLALQIQSESGLRALDLGSWTWEADGLNEGAESAYSMTVHPQWGWICTGTTNFVSEGHLEIRATDGTLLYEVEVGVAPGTLVWQQAASTSSIERPVSTVQTVHPSLIDLSGRVLPEGSTAGGLAGIHLVFDGARVVKELRFNN
jgi:hypothetical protein